MSNIQTSEFSKTNPLLLLVKARALGAYDVYLLPPAPS